MPEIAGNAALIVDPYSIDDIAEAMLKMSTDAELRQKLIDAGNIKKKDYSWDITAQKLWQLVEKVMAK
jgi:glycosyltransferase involved in cell wall biosynthesis